MLTSDYAAVKSVQITYFDARILLITDFGPENLLTTDFGGSLWDPHSSDTADLDNDIFSAAIFRQYRYVYLHFYAMIKCRVTKVLRLFITFASSFGLFR